MNVSVHTVKRARSVQNHGIPELVDAVQSGKMSVTPASEIAKLTPKEQRGMVAAKWATLSEGRPPQTTPIGAVSIKEAAGLLKVGENQHAQICAPSQGEAAKMLSAGSNEPNNCQPIVKAKEKYETCAVSI